MPGNRVAKDDLRIVYHSILLATSRISSSFFEVVRQRNETEVESVYRERVYCYELYHQLRQLLPDHFPYVIHGELDKRGQHFVNSLLNGDYAPDLLVHRPGRMQNLVIMEVKPAACSPSEADHDIEKMAGFISNVHYQMGILLFFGPNPVRQKCRQEDGIVYLHHKKAMTPALRVRLPEPDTVYDLGIG